MTDACPSPDATLTNSAPPTIRCPAKVNLALSVGPRDAEGYHPIASWMLAVDLYDDLTLVPAEAESQYDLGWADDAPQTSPIEWPLEEDLTVRAHRLVEQHVGRPLPVKLILRKRIPVGAGLAGGSSDGAGMLLALNRLFDLKLSRDTLVELAMQLGSDLAFFLSAGSAVVTGRGEKIEPLPHRPVNLALILPPLLCPTGAVYRKFDVLNPIASVDESAVRDVVEGRGEPFNDLAAAACAVEPRLADLRTAIRLQQHRPVHVTGSGSALFIHAVDADDADLAARQVQYVHQLPALAVQAIALPADDTGAPG